MLYLFQGTSDGRSGSQWLDRCLAAGNPVPPADFLHGAVTLIFKFTGAVLEEEVPVYSVWLLSVSTAGIVYVGVTDENSEHLCHLPGGASKGVSSVIGAKVA